MKKIYQPIGWEDFPSEKTPINSENLGKMDSAINEIDSRVVEHEHNKLSKTDASSDIVNVEYNEDTSVFEFTKRNGDVKKIAISNVVVDDSLSEISTNPVQNKVVTEEFRRLSEENSELKGDLVNCGIYALTEIEWVEGYTLAGDMNYYKNAKWGHTEIKLSQGDRVKGTFYSGSKNIAGLAICDGLHFLHDKYHSKEIEGYRPSESGTALAFHVDYTATKQCVLVISCILDYEKPTMNPSIEVIRNKDFMDNDLYPDWENRPEMNWTSGYVSSDGDLTLSKDDSYRFSNLIYIPKGYRIAFKATGSDRATLLAKYDKTGRFIKSIILGGTYYRYDRFWISDEDCYVRITHRNIASSVTTEYYFLDNEIDVRIYNQFALKESPLYGKKMVVIGDSLIYGSKTGNDIVWCNLLAQKYSMELYNYGINGNAISSVKGGTGTPMSERYTDIADAVPNADIIVVEGGANDRNNKAIIGTIEDTDNATFMGAINTLIDGLREKYPNKVILFMTTYMRYGHQSGSNWEVPSEKDYIEAMMEVCTNKSVPCYDNRNSGITFLDENISAWADEGVWIDGNANKHFSPDAYKYLARQYEKWIESYMPY